MVFTPKIQMNKARFGLWWEKLATSPEIKKLPFSGFCQPKSWNTLVTSIVFVPAVMPLRRPNEAWHDESIK